MSVMVPVSWGEVIDKATILQIKAARIEDAAKRANVAREQAALAPLVQQARAAQPEVASLETALRAVNEALWDIEDALRDCERQQDFGPRFIALARSVYRENDRRARLKGDLNRLLGSDLVEEKSYQPY